MQTSIKVKRSKTDRVILGISYVLLGLFVLSIVVCSLRSSAVAVPFLNGRFPTQNGRSFFNQVT